MEWMEIRKEKNTLSNTTFGRISLTIKEVKYKCILLDSTILFS